MIKTKDITQLINQSWLAGLPANTQDELIKATRFRQYTANQRVHSKHESADGLYGVLKGEVRISATTPAGAEVVFARVHAGNWFGEIALLDGGVRTHDAYTTTQTDMAVLPKDVITKICQKHPKAYQALVILLCQHCRQAFATVDEFLLYNPEQRMAKRVLHRLHMLNNQRIIISQHELGALVGISRQSANKILRSWQAKGWIQRIYRGLEVIQKESLEQLVTPFDH